MANRKKSPSKVTSTSAADGPAVIIRSPDRQPQEPPVISEKTRFSLPLANTIAIACGAASFIFTMGMLYQYNNHIQDKVNGLEVRADTMEARQRSNSVKIHDMCRAVGVIQKFTVPEYARTHLECDFAE